MVFARQSRISSDKAIHAQLAAEALNVGILSARSVETLSN